MGTLALAAALSGCDEYVSPNTADWDLSEVSVMCSLRSNGEGVLVVVHPAVPSEGDFPSSAVLGPRDTLAAAVGGDAARELDSLGEPGSYAEFAHFFPAAVSEVGLELARGGGEERVSGSVPLPEPFVLRAPSEPVAADAAIELSWEPASDLPPQGQTLTLSVWGDCLRTTVVPLQEDLGVHTIEPGALVFEGLTGDCQLTFTLERTRYGLQSIGPNGLCNASQVRTSQITVTP